jgi:hypothetical protein
MEFNIRPLNSSDYDNILCKWWKDWKWDAPLRDFLPDNGEGGIMILDGDEPVCAGFLYTTNSNVAWVDWIVSSRTYRKKPHRKEAIVLLIDTLTNICKNSGAKYSYALIKHKALADTYLSLGYTNGDSYTTEMIKKL